MIRGLAKGPGAVVRLTRRLAGRLCSSYVSVMGILSLGAVGTALYLSPVTASHTTSRTREAADTHTNRSSTTIGKGRSPLVLGATGTRYPPSTLKASSSTKTKPATVTHQLEIVKDQPFVVRIPSGSSTRTEKIVETATPARTTPPAPTGATTTTTPGGTTTASPSTPKDPTTTTTRPKTTTTTSPYLVPTKAALLSPAADYWGVAINGVPGGVSQLNALDAEVGEAPSTLEWFQGWDESFPSQYVQTSWQRGALPLLTWESKPTVDSTPATSDPQYSLSKILAGNFDSYLSTFAHSVAATGMPVVIRFDQEMNGNWYPWSEGVNGNAPGSFAATWQHVWDIFQTAGANKYVIWMWAVNRMDRLPKATPALGELYPGDQYVDLVGIDAYWRYATDPPTFAGTFGKTLGGLAALTTKPVFIAETSAIETDPTTGASQAVNKAAWTTSFFAGLQGDPQIIGFSWFDNVAAPTSDGTTVENDWRIDSDPQTLLAFKTGLAAGNFLRGLMPNSN